VSISRAEARRLLVIIMDEEKLKLNKFLNENNLTLDQNAYDAVLDLFYKRNSNPLTREVVVAMADRDDEKVISLLSDFPERYANKYLYKDYTDPDERAMKIQGWLDRNLDGLNNRIRREIEIYQNGISEEVYK